MMSTLFTSDAKYVLSGSDDGNVRIWKAKAHEKLGILDSRERAAIEYRESLKQKWKADAQVSKVSRYVSKSSFISIICLILYCFVSYRTRHLPRPVYKAGQLKSTMLEAQRVKEERRRKHTRAGESKPKAEKRTVVITEQT